VPAPANALKPNKATTPAWPDLDAAQRREALAAEWPKRLTTALGSGAALAFLMAMVSYQGAPEGSIGWRAPVSLALAAAMLGGYVASRKSALPGPLLAPIGLAAVLVTHLNLMSCVMERMSATEGYRSGAADPVFILLTLVVGTLWALRIDLSMQGFTWMALITTAILWAPWVFRTSAPAEFGLVAAAAIATGAQLRFLGVERAYDAYRREQVWPQLWKKHLRAAVERELVPLLASMQGGDAPVASSEQRGEESVVRLANALLESTAPLPQTQEASFQIRERTPGK
jgi:hypothetical protein